MKTETKKVPFFQDLEKINDVTKHANNLCKIVQEILDNAAEKGLEPNQSFYENYLSQGQSYVVKELQKVAMDSIKKLGIKSETVKKNLLAGMDEEAVFFRGAFDNLQRQVNKPILFTMGYTHIGIHDIVVRDGKAQLLDKTKAKIISDNTVELNTPERKDFWAMLCEMAEVYNKMEAFLIDKEIGGTKFNLFPPNMNADYFLREADFKIKPNPASLIFI